MKLGLGALTAGMLLAGCGGAASSRLAVAPGAGTASAASCAALSPAQQFAMAHVVFVGRMLPGPPTGVGGARVLTSPAAVRVIRYLKGHGSALLKVQTAVTVNHGGVTQSEDAIAPQAGQLWKIYSDSRHQPLDTSICAGSTMIRSPARVALELWRAFPVDASPRPVVPLGEGLVLAPSPGFPDGASKLAYMEGRFRLDAALPTGPGVDGGYPVISATGAFHRLLAAGRPSGENVAPLVIHRVRLATATFLTDRGRRELPAWQFFLRGVSAPAAVLALAPPAVFVAPGLQQLGPPGPGNSIEDSARIDHSGTAITLSFIGAPAGSRPCDARYVAHATADRHAVAFTIETIPAPAPPDTACTAVGYGRTAVLHLSAPLGARVLISATDGGAVPVTR